MFLLDVFQPLNLCKMDGEEEEGKSLVCQVVSGMQRRETCGTAPPPKRAILLVTLGATCPKKLHRRYDFIKCIFIRLNLLRRCGFILVCEQDDYFLSLLLSAKSPRKTGRGMDYEPTHQTADRYGLFCESN